MKTKDILALVILGVVLAVIGSVLVSKFSSSKNRSAQVEVVQPINPAFNDEAREILRGGNEQFPVSSYAPPANTQNLGNGSPFRPE
jgi:type II secretory pathway pseudopilin PulG